VESNGKQVEKNPDSEDGVNLRLKLALDEAEFVGTENGRRISLRRLESNETD